MRSLRSSLRATAVAALVLASGCGPAGSPPPEEGEGPYNVVLVLSDTLRAASLSLHGYPRATTPALDALAEEAVVFERHFAAYPATPTSVSQMMSGRFVPPLLMDHSFALAPVHALPDDLLVLPRELRAAGYATGLVTSHPWFNERARLLPHFDRVVVVEPRPGEAYAPFEALARPVEDFLAGASEPFFLYVHTMDTHGPFVPHPELGPLPPPAAGSGVERFPPPYDLYDGEIRYTDLWLGRLLDRLRAGGLLDRTVFVFTSDHGEDLGELGPEFWNRGHGHTLRRSQLHVPLVVRLPGGRAGGTRHAATTSHLDLAPTLLALAGVEGTADRFRLDGRDLSARLGGGAEEDSPRAVHAFTWRYWGLHEGELELHYDQWRDDHALYRTRPGPFNYPLPERLDPEASAADTAALARRLGRVRRAALAETLALPAARLDRAVVGVPTIVLSSERPTWRRADDDDRWFQDAASLLEAAPGERPGPLELATPFAPGRYRVRLRLDRRRLADGWANRLRLRLGGGAAVEVDGAAAAEDGTVDLGAHTLGRTLVVELADPEGGVAIHGLVLERAGADAAAAADPAAEAALEEQLRALGYVQ